MRGKKYQEIKSKIDKEKAYPLEEAIDFIQQNPCAKFDETIEIHVCLGINPKKTEQQVRGTVILPGGAIKKAKIAAFVSDGKETLAKEAGADIVGGKNLIEEIKKTKKCDFDIAIAEPEIMKDLSQIAKILGPRGLMPNPKSDTVTTDIKKTIEELKKGKIDFKNDSGGNIHQAIGKISWPKEKVIENFDAFFASLKKIKPAGIKGSYIKNIALSSTMGPSLKVQL